MLPPLPDGPGLVFVLSGPAGSGKTTLCDRLMAASARARRVVTCTSRPPRPGERNGVDYHFLTEAQFTAGLAADEFFEHALVFGRHYGSRRADVRALLGEKFDVLFNIDVQGAATLRQNAAADPSLAGRVISIFLYPPPLADLRARLLSRAQDAEVEIERRLALAATEAARWPEFDYCLTSSARENDLMRLLAIYQAERLRPRAGWAPSGEWLAQA